MVEKKGTDLMSLPNGTKFHVNNGNWDGEIVDKEDGKYIIVNKEDCEREFKITENYRYTLFLSHVKIPENKPQSEWNKGAAHARDLIIANIIGMQNEEILTDTPRYTALQELLECIIDTYGDMMQPFKD